MRKEKDTATKAAQAKPAAQVKARKAATQVKPAPAQAKKAPQAKPSAAQVKKAAAAKPAPVVPDPVIAHEPARARRSDGPSEDMPMTHKDILDFKTRFGLTVTKACQILGINRIKYMAMVKPENLPVLIKDPSVEILLRVYYDQPQLLLADAPPDMIRLFNGIKENEPGALEKDWQFSVMFGRHMGQTYNWMKSRTVTPKVARLVDAMEALKKGGLANPATYIRSIAEKTAAARNVTPFSNGKWTMPGQDDMEDDEDD